MKYAWVPPLKCEPERAIAVYHLPWEGSGPDPGAKLTMLCAARRFRPNKPRQVGPSLGGQYFWFFDCKLRWLLVPIRLKTLRNQCIFTRFEDGATHHRVIIFNVLFGPSLVKASLHDRAPKDAAKKVHISHKHQLAWRRVHVGKCNCQMDGFKIWNYSILFRLCGKPRCGNAMDQTWTQTTMHSFSPKTNTFCLENMIFEDMWKFCSLSPCCSICSVVLQVHCFPTWVEQKVRQAMLQRQNEFAFGCSIFYLLAVTLQRMLSSWTSHHHIISSLPFPSSTHFCTPRMYLA